MTTIVSIWGSQRTLWGWEARAILRVEGEQYDRVEQLAWPGQETEPLDIQARVDALVFRIETQVAAEHTVEGGE